MCSRLAYAASPRIATSKYTSSLLSVMDNHLIIALGGTGGKMLRSLRRTIYQNLRREEPPTVNIRYLYVDSELSLIHI